MRSLILLDTAGIVGCCHSAWPGRMLAGVVGATVPGFSCGFPFVCKHMHRSGQEATNCPDACCNHVNEFDMNTAQDKSFTHRLQQTSRDRRYGHGMATCGDVDMACRPDSTCQHRAQNITSRRRFVDVKPTAVQDSMQPWVTSLGDAWRQVAHGKVIREDECRPRHCRKPASQYAPPCSRWCTPVNSDNSRILIKLKKLFRSSV